MELSGYKTDRGEKEELRLRLYKDNSEQDTVCNQADISLKSSGNTDGNLFFNGSLHKLKLLPSLPLNLKQKQMKTNWSFFQFCFCFVLLFLLAFVLGWVVFMLLFCFVSLECCCFVFVWLLLLLFCCFLVGAGVCVCVRACVRACECVCV